MDREGEFRNRDSLRPGMGHRILWPLLVLITCLFLPHAQQHPGHVPALLPSTRQTVQHTPSQDRTHPEQQKQPSACTNAKPAGLPNASPTSSGPDSGGTQSLASVITLVQSLPQNTILTFTMGDYSLETTHYRGQDCTSINVAPNSQTIRLRRRNAPELPGVRRDIMIPPDSTPVVEIVDIDIEEHPDVSPPVPSPGYARRPNQPTPPDFGPEYSGDQPYPATNVALTDIYNIRRMVGVGVLVYPFQYVPATRTLRVVRSLTMRIDHRPSGPAATSQAVNALPTSGPFLDMASTRFANTVEVSDEWSADTTLAQDNSASATSQAIEDTGNSLLLVVPTAWADNSGLTDFILWKRQRGLEVELARFPDDMPGANADRTALKQLIDERYAASGLTYIILVGDHDSIPVYQTDDPPSDTLYTRIGTGDWYHDILISRISAANEDDLNNQFEKLIAYEKSPPGTDWFTKGTMVGSDNISSYFGKKDREILEEERQELETYGYTSFDQLYDGIGSYPTAAQLTDALNEGRSLFYYLGHGYTDRVVTTGFDVDDAYALENTDSLPLVLVGACTVGDFTDSSDCLSEALMKASSANGPTGAVSVISATEPMDWDPPIVMIEAFTSYITQRNEFEAGEMEFTGSAPYVIGAQTFMSVQRAMDYCYATDKEGSDAAELIMEQTHILGDCTLSLRTAQPKTITITHGNFIPPGGTFTVNATDSGGTPMADVTICVYAGPEEQFTALTDENGTADIVVGSITQETATVTAFRRDCVPAQTELEIAEEGPVILSPETLPIGHVGTAYSYLLSAYGGVTPYSWSIISGTIPGLTIDGTDGALEGIPTEAGTYTITVRLVDSDDPSGSATMDLNCRIAKCVDLNTDGETSDEELLAYINQWAGGAVSEFDVNSAISLWQEGPAESRGTGNAIGSLSLQGSVPQDAIEYRIAMTSEGDIERIAALVALVSNVWKGYVFAYCTPAQVTALTDAGFTPEILSKTETRAERSGSYHTYASLTTYLEGLADAHPDICRLESIGQSVEGREIWTLKITDNPDIEEPEPEYRLVGGIHGDEPPGMEVCIGFAEWLLTEYSEQDTAAQLVDNCELWILPLLNPDGLEAGTRENAAGDDLNRSFPDGVESDIGAYFDLQTCDTSGRQPETAALMNWSCTHSFGASLGFHTGAFLACYPYGNNPEKQAVNTPTPDDNLFRELAKTYTFAHPTMSTDGGYPNEGDDDGIINSAAWYPVVGEMPDWNYRFLGTYAITVELSENKEPDAADLDAVVADNIPAITAFLTQVQRRFTGTITDAQTGEPISAKVRVKEWNDNSGEYLDVDHDIYSDPDVGDYHRPVPPGTYVLQISAPGYNDYVSGELTVQDEPVTHSVRLSRTSEHILTRVFPAPYVPATANAVTLSIDMNEASLPNGIIISEIIPPTCEYTDRSALFTTGTELRAPRKESDRISWVLWGNEVKDSVFTYKLAIAYEQTDAITFQGNLVTSDQTFSTQGQYLWDAKREYMSLELEKGWNLVSFPLRSGTASPEAFLGTDPDATLWTWTGEHYEVADTVATKTGYWLQTDEGGTILLSGIPETAEYRTVTPGWNLIGPLADIPPPTIAGILGYCYGWNGRYTVPTVLQAGKGYWVRADNTVELPMR